MVTPRQLNRRAALFEQLAAMISAGVPLPKAMEMVARNRSTGMPPRVLEELTAHLKEGHTFSDAMQLVSGQKRENDAAGRPRKAYTLSEFDVALLSAGEEAGRLDQTFKLLAHYYASRAKIIYEAIASLAITTVTVHVFLLVFPIGLLQQFALGIMHGQYRDCVPFLVEKAVVFGGLYGLAWFLMFACQGNRRPGWRSVMERFFGMVPWLGASVKCLSVARLAMALEALLGAGVPMIRAWELAAASSGSQKLRSDITRWAPELEVGTTPAEMVVQIRYFPEMFTHLYQTGEMSGKLDETLEHLHTYFQDEGFRQLRIFCRVLNFVIYFGVAAFIAVFIIRFWLNYFNQALGAF